jgi:hypothetical protein
MIWFVTNLHATLGWHVILTDTDVNILAVYIIW